MKAINIKNIPEIGASSGTEQLEKALAGLLREYILPNFAAISASLDGLEKRVEKLELNRRFEIELTIKKEKKETRPEYAKDTNEPEDTD
ncbi:MAG: hypothetical protein JRI45_06745 [Deltaproteobacteria bacterium]|nr:hypothetical protein [Deltaproteobacteria bacterium]